MDQGRAVSVCAFSNRRGGTSENSLNLILVTLQLKALFSPRLQCEEGTFPGITSGQSSALAFPVVYKALSHVQRVDACTRVYFVVHRYSMYVHVHMRYSFSDTGLCSFRIVTPQISLCLGFLSHRLDRGKFWEV